MPSSSQPAKRPAKRAAPRAVDQRDLAIAELRDQLASMSKRVEALESVAAAQRRRQAAAVASKLKQSPEQLALLKEIVGMAESGDLT